MKRLILLTVLAGFLQPADYTAGSEISNFFTPYGFRAPLLQQGQFALNFNPHYYRQEFGENPPSGYGRHIDSSSKRYGLSLNGVYAVTDELSFQSMVILYPGQTRSTATRRDIMSTPSGEVTAEWKTKEHSDFTVSPGVGVSFRPQANIQLYGDFHFTKEKSYLETEYEERVSDLTHEEIYFDLGFTILGRATAHRSTGSSNSRLFSFLRPYGFRAPVLSQGQYALNLNSLYVRTESFYDYFDLPDWEKSIWRRYYFSLNGLYAVTERLLLQSSLDIYPPQTRETYDRVGVGSRLDYDEMCSDFAVFPGLVVSLRPKISMEFYGVFLFTGENLHKKRESGLQSELSQDYYYFDLGYTILLRGSLRGSGPIPGSELSNFFTPSGFRTPLLLQGQGAINVEFHHDRTESEEHHPRDLRAIDIRSTKKRYYLSLNGVYAVIDQLIFECGLDVLPGQTRATNRYTWFSDISGDSDGTTGKQHSRFAVFPRLEVSFRPQANMEFYGVIRFNKEREYIENSSEIRTKDLRNEDIYLDFGLTILGIP
jgi:hypothetical protein